MNKVIHCIKYFAVTFVLSFCYFQSSAVADSTNPKVLILYHLALPNISVKAQDRPILLPQQNPLTQTSLSYSKLLKKEAAEIEEVPAEVILLSNLLGHFNADIASAPIDKYYPGMMKNYGYVFYLGWKAHPNISQAFMEDIPKNPKVTVTWIRENINQFLKKYETTYGFQVQPERGGFRNLFYNEKLYPRKDVEEVPIIQVKDWNKTTTYGYLASKSGIAPFCVNSSNLWFFPDLSFYDINYLVFADLLHDVLDIQHEVNRNYFIRIEDIHPLRDPSKLRNIGTELVKKNIPFMMAVIPIYFKPGHKMVYLKDKPHLVQVLKDCESKGGSILMHGYTHAWRNESGEGHEFWDVPHDRPIDEYTERTIHDKLKKGIQELVRLGLYPLAWETPHYAASKEAYQIFSQYFSIAVEDRQISKKTYKATQNFPYIINRDIYGQTIIPENLGYINLEEGETVEKKLEKAEIYKIVRDSVVGFFFHPYYKPKYMMEVVSGLEQLGYSPLDLRDIPGVVSSENMVILSGISNLSEIRSTSRLSLLGVDPHMLKVKLDHEYLNTYLLDYHYRTFVEKWSKEIGTGDAVLEVPSDPKSLFVIKFMKHKPGPVTILKQIFVAFVIGKTSSQVETMQRWVVWCLFGFTVYFLFVVLRVFWTRISYHKSHFRKKKE
ncbi:MAG: polysaccharide deacetylase family protein [Candidatus Omnitrophica bacterium]|nr:polysaccharide deacetylase family protein [Candidatus Omnitrophota bacterium]